MKKLGKCQIAGCSKEAQFGLYCTGEIKRWVYVCSEHEKKIGRENLERAGGYLGSK